MIQVSLFGSAVRKKLWVAMFESLKSTSINYEVVFSGNADIKYKEFLNESFTYIKTGNIKPAQCYELSRRGCVGETVVWIADDCEFPNDVIGKAYRYWKLQNNEKLILSIQTKESGYEVPKLTLFDMNNHRFFGGKKNTELMAPIAMMSRKFLDKIGGFDKRFICGQYENFCVKMAYELGAKVEIFGDEECFVEIDHLAKSYSIGESTDRTNFRKRPFAKGWENDRKILEDHWTIYNINVHWRLLSIFWNIIFPQKKLSPYWYKYVSPKLIGKFEPYPKTISLTKSEEPRGDWN